LIKVAFAEVAPAENRETRVNPMTNAEIVAEVLLGFCFVFANAKDMLGLVLDKNSDKNEINPFVQNGAKTITPMNNNIPLNIPCTNANENTEFAVAGSVSEKLVFNIVWTCV
jgi:hypothetical protein